MKVITIFYVPFFSHSSQMLVALQFQTQVMSITHQVVHRIPLLSQRPDPNPKTKWFFKELTSVAD